MVCLVQERKNENKREKKEKNKLFDKKGNEIKQNKQVYEIP